MFELEVRGLELEGLKKIRKNFEKKISRLKTKISKLGLKFFEKNFQKKKFGFSGKNFRKINFSEKNSRKKNVSEKNFSEKKFWKK